MCGLINIERFVRTEVLRQMPPGVDIVTDGEGAVLAQFPSGAVVPVADLVREHDRAIRRQNTAIMRMLNRQEVRP